MRLFGRNRTSQLLPEEPAIPERPSAGDGQMETAVIANLGAGVALVRATDGDIVYVNDRWDRLFGYGPGELLGRHISVVNAATEQTPGERAREIFEGLKRDGVWSGEVHNVRKDGTPFWTWCSVSRLEHPEHGDVWVSVNTDITARKGEVDRLHSEVQRYRRLFDASPAGLAMIAPDLRLELVNQAFSDIVGYPRDELHGTLLPDLTHPDDIARCTKLRDDVLSGETSRYRIEERLLTRQGAVLPVALTANVIRGPDGAPIADIATIEKLEGDTT